MRKLLIFLGALVLSLGSFTSYTASAQTLPGLKSDEALVIYSLETDDERLHYEMIWAPYDPETETYKSKKGKKKKIKTFDGKTLAKKRRGNKTYKRYYYRVVDPGTYVLHSVSGPASSTSYHPETIGFEVEAGEAVFLGYFKVFQGKDVFRANIDPTTGVSLELLDTDFQAIALSAEELQTFAFPKFKDYLVTREPVYFITRDYQ